MNSKDRRIKKLEESLKEDDMIIVPIYIALKLGCKGIMSREEFNKLPKEIQQEIIQRKNTGSWL